LRRHATGSSSVSKSIGQVVTDFYQGVLHGDHQSSGELSSGVRLRASAYSDQWGIMDGPYSQGYDYDKFGNMTHRYGWGGKVQGGTCYARQPATS